MTWRVTPAERRALLALSRDIPRHPVDLKLRDRVRFMTLRQLCTVTGHRPILVERLELKPSWGNNLPGIPFYRLTEAGDTLRQAVAAARP